MPADSALVLWDIDRTLVYVGNTDRQVYRDVFAAVVGRPAERLPERGTGVTMPMAVRRLLLDNGVEEKQAALLLPSVLELLPQHLAALVPEMRRSGVVLPGAPESLKAVQAAPGLVPTVVTGNLRPNALIKLRTFGLDAYLDAGIGAYASDSADRPALVGLAQERARERHGVSFSRENTVIIGDSLEDVRTGLLGGASVIGVASGVTPAEDLLKAGAAAVLPDLRSPERVLSAIASLT